jgi:cytochrome c-type biogenesis protein CcmH/NrfG
MEYPAASLVIALALTTLPAASCAQDFSQTQTRPAPQAALIDQANDALSRADYPAALKLLTALNTQTPNDPHVLYDLGLTLEAIGSAAVGPAALELATPTTGNEQRTTGAFPTPESYYRQSIAADPLFPDAHLALGLLLARTAHPSPEQIAEARTQLLTATQIPDTDPALKARAFRALARLDLDSTPPNSPAAAADLLEALKLTPEQPSDILLSAQVAEGAADLPSAEQAYRRYLAAAPQDTAATAALGHILLAEHHPAEAELLLIPALTAQPGNSTFSAQLAEAYLASGDPAKVAEAAPLLEKFRATHPGDANLTRLLARVYVETGHPDQADPLYAALISQNETGPDPAPDPTLLDDRADALIRLHRPAEAERLLKQATADPAGFPTPAAYGDAVTHLAFAAAEIDDPRMTLQALSLRAKVLPPSPSTLFLEATANDSLRQTRQAVDLYKQFLAAAHGEYPDQESQARQRLAALEPAK